MHLLVTKYRDPDKPGLLNYLNLHHDIVAIGCALAQEKELMPVLESNVDLVPLLVSITTAMYIFYQISSLSLS